MSDMQWKMWAEHNVATKSYKRISAAVILFGNSQILATHCLLGVSRKRHAYLECVDSSHNWFWLECCYNFKFLVLYLWSFYFKNPDVFQSTLWRWAQSLQDLLPDAFCMPGNSSTSLWKEVLKLLWVSQGQMGTEARWSLSLLVCFKPWTI